MKSGLSKVLFIFSVFVGQKSLLSKRDPITGPLMMTEESADKEKSSPLLSSQDLYLKASRIAQQLFDEQQSIEKIVQQAQVQERDLADKIDVFAKSFGQKRGHFQGVINKLEKYIEARLAEFTKKMPTVQGEEAAFLSSMIEKITGISNSLATFKTDLEKNSGEYQKIIDLRNQVYQQDQTLNEKQFAFLQLVSRINKLKSNMNLQENLELQKQTFSEIEAEQTKAEQINQELKSMKSDFSAQIQQGLQAIDVGLQQLEQQLKGMEANIDAIAKMINEQTTQQEAKMIQSIQEVNKKNKLQKELDKSAKDAQESMLVERKMFNWIKKFIVDLKGKMLRMEEVKAEKLLPPAVQPPPAAPSVATPSTAPVIPVQPTVVPVAPPAVPISALTPVPPVQDLPVVTPVQVVPDQPVEAVPVVATPVS